jgi:hypothetical protein
MFFEARRGNQEHVSILYTLSAGVCVDGRLAIVEWRFLDWRLRTGIADCRQVAGRRLSLPVAGPARESAIGNSIANRQFNPHSTIQSALDNLDRHSAIERSEICNQQSTIESG